MQITKLVLENFSSYENENVFDFTTKKGKPIVLIGGQNGAGKTSLFTAIKIALYGSLAFGYSADNSFYFRKIKSFINYKAFQSENFISGVSIDLKIKNERDIKLYTISRKWSMVDKKIVEDYQVFENGILFNESERNFFESYLKSLVPPDLFDFFLFDGEEVGNIFSSDNYNKYVKNSMLTMCGIDVFSIIQSFCKSYVSRTNKVDNEYLLITYHHLEEEIFIKQANLDAQKSRLENFQKQIDSYAVLIEQKEREFLRAGGILKEKVQQMEDEVDSLTKKREVLSRQIKAFFENMMPFYLVKSLIPQIENQINFEEKQSIFEYVSYMVSQDFIRKSLEGKTDNTEYLSEHLYNSILDKLRPAQSKSTDIILDLSKDDHIRIEQMMTSIEDVDAKKIIKKIKQKESYTARIVSINQQIRESLSQEDTKKYVDEIEDAKSKIESLQIARYEAEQDIAELKEEIDILKHEQQTVYKDIVENAQNKHVYELSSSISQIMGKLIDEKCVDIRKQLAKKTIENLKRIYRKENLISIIDVTEDFKFNLYQSQSFTLTEIKSLVSNIGYNEFYKVIGEKSKKILYDYFKVFDTVSLNMSIEMCSTYEHKFNLYKKIDLAALSKGERQIFILALYWSIIQISGKKIPFIIDTPYARIDANHREEISRKFFPRISSQVIILSTDEEITKEYYDIIKPFISKEYLLRNDKSENKTTVERGYFFKED